MGSGCMRPPTGRFMVGMVVCELYAPGPGEELLLWAVFIIRSCSILNLCSFCFSLSARIFLFVLATLVSKFDWSSINASSCA